jgi:hypothetical protein
MLNLKSSHILNGLGPFCRLVCPPMGPELVLEDELGTFRAHIHTRTRRNTHTHMRAHTYTHTLPTHVDADWNIQDLIISIPLLDWNIRGH